MITKNDQNQTYKYRSDSLTNQLQRLHGQKTGRNTWKVMGGFQVECSQVMISRKKLQYLFSMGNNEFSVSSDVRSQWGEKGVARRRIFYNKITLEQFQLIVLSKLQTHCSIPQLVHRSIYPLPHTPKVIILNDQHAQLSLLAQRPTTTLAAAIADLSVPLEILLVLREVVLALKALSLRFGPFAVSSAQLGAGQRGEPLVWINSCFQSSDIQNPLPHNAQGEAQMVVQVMGLLGAMVPPSIYQKLFADVPQNLNRALECLEEVIEAERNMISPSKQSWRPVLLTPLHSNSPKNNLSLLNPPKLEQKAKKQIKTNHNIPNFIKKNKNQKRKTSNSPPPGRVTSPNKHNHENIMGRRDKNKGKQQASITKVRSLNASPEPTKLTSTLNSTANSFNQSQGRLDYLTFSKHSSKSNRQPKELEIPLIHSLSSTEIPAAERILEVNEEQSFYPDITFNVPAVPFSTGILGSLCKSMSRSQELHESMARILDSANLSLQVGMEESMVVHKMQGSGGFEGGHLALYEEISRVLF